MSNEWFTALLTDTFGENGGILGMSLAVGGFLLSELFLLLVILRKQMRTHFRDVWAGAVVVIVFQLLLTPYPGEAFGNAASYGVYTFSYNEAVLLTALLVLLYGTEFKGTLKWLLTALFLILTVLTADGAWAMAVVMLFIYTIAVVWYWAHRARGRILVSAGAALYFAIFFINLFSPTTQAELAVMGEARISLIKTVWYSVVTALPYAIQCLNVACVIGALLLLPLLMKAVREKDGCYPLPALVSIVSFGFFVTLFFPSLYTSGLVGGTQVLNVYRWAFYLWLYGNEAYWVGWYTHRGGEAAAENMGKLPSEENVLEKEKSGGNIIAIKLRQEKYQIPVILGMTVLTLLVVVIPLFVISHYNFLSADDLWHGSEAARVWRETHSVGQVAVTAAKYVAELWQTRQGVYASGWLSITLIGIFAENTYYMGAYLGLGGFVLSEFILFTVILRKLLGADILRSLIVSLGVISLQVLLTDVPVEAFFWFTSAICYTGCYNAAILLCAILIWLYFPSPKRREGILLSIQAVLLSVLVAGGSYVTGITMALILALAVVWYWYRKNRRRWFVTADFIIYMACFLLNVMAPGNMARLDSSGEAVSSVTEAVFLSLREATIYLYDKTSFSCVILGVMLAPVFLHIVQAKKYRYSWPVVVTLFSFGLFAAQYAPNFYTLGIAGAGRVLNIYCWTYFILIYGNELYWLGWFARRKRENMGAVLVSAKTCYLLPGWMSGSLILLLSLMYGYVYPSTLTTVSAIQDLQNGGAALYYEEWQERLEILQDSSIQDAVLEPFSYTPYLLCFDDIEEDLENWKNTSMADRYDKNSVILDTGE